MSTRTNSPLRQRMIEDMSARHLGVASQRSHIRACKRFATFSNARRTPQPAKIFACSNCI